MFRAGFVHSLLDEAAELSPYHTALLTDEQALTYLELKEQSLRLASYLHNKGVKRGDRVAILLPNSIPVVVAVMAASRLGALYVVLDMHVQPYQLAHLLADAAPRVLLTSYTFLQVVREVQSEVALFLLEDDWAASIQEPFYSAPAPAITLDLASLIYTSGSTGRPKAVMSTHYNIRFATWAIQQSLHMESSDIIGLFLPLSHDYGLYQVFLTFQVRATLALGAGLKLNAGPLLLNKLNEWRVTGLPLVPHLADILLRLCQRPNAKIPALRYITNTGMHLSLATIEELKKVFRDARIYVMFGQTECKRISILDPSDFARKQYSVGRPLCNTECFVVGPDGVVVPPGTPGELVVRGPHVMAGYWNDVKLTQERYRRWGPGLEHALFTGDFFTQDEEGFLYFHGRQDDIYKQKGCRVSAPEVEMAALDIEGVQQAVLIPRVDQQGAVLFIQGSLRQQEVLQQLSQRLESEKVPERIVCFEQLPYTSNGKIDKQALKNSFLKDVNNR